MMEGEDCTPGTAGAQVENGPRGTRGSLDRIFRAIVSDQAVQNFMFATPIPSL